MKKTIVLSLLLFVVAVSAGYYFFFLNKPAQVIKQEKTESEKLLEEIESFSFEAIDAFMRKSESMKKYGSIPVQGKKGKESNPFVPF